MWSLQVCEFVLNLLETFFFPVDSIHEKMKNPKYWRIVNVSLRWYHYITCSFIHKSVSKLRAGKI